MLATPSAQPFDSSEAPLHFWCEWPPARAWQFAPFGSVLRLLRTIDGESRSAGKEKNAWAERQLLA